MDFEYDVILREVSMEVHSNIQREKEDFTEEVQEYLDDGWKLQGGVSITFADGALVMAQAIMRKN